MIYFGFLLSPSSLITTYLDLFFLYQGVSLLDNGTTICSVSDNLDRCFYEFSLSFLCVHVFIIKCSQFITWGDGRIRKNAVLVLCYYSLMVRVNKGQSHSSRYTFLNPLSLSLPSALVKIMERTTFYVKTSLMKHNGRVTSGRKVWKKYLLLLYESHLKCQILVFLLIIIYQMFKIFPVFGQTKVSFMYFLHELFLNFAVEDMFYEVFSETNFEVEVCLSSLYYLSGNLSSYHCQSGRSQWCWVPCC